MDSQNLHLACLTPEHEVFRQSVRRFVNERIKPVASQWELDGHMPRDVLKEMGALGWLGLRYPEEYGGSAWDTLASVVLAEELGRSTFGGVSITVLTQTDTASPHLMSAGTPAQKQRYLPGVIRGDLLMAIAMTETEAGSDISGLRTRAVREGHEWVLNGSKMFITNAVYADLYVVAVRTNPDVKASRGISLMLVERGTPGFTVGCELDKLGWRSSDTAELVFVDCRIPAENLLGDVDAGFYTLMKNVQNERLVLAAQAIGEAAAALELTLTQVRQRQAFGDSLWHKQTIRQRLAMLFARLSAARHLVYNTAWAHDQGHDCVLEVSMIKALCGELVNEVMYECQQFHGGYGLMRGSAIERLFRDARVHAIGGGATEVMLEEVAKRMPWGL